MAQKVSRREHLWSALWGDRAERRNGDSPSVPPVETRIPSADAIIAETLADAVTEGVIRVGADGRIVAANAPACALFGVTRYPPPPGEMLGQTLLEATHLRAVAQLFQSAVESDQPQEAEVQLVGRAERLVRVRAVPIAAAATVLLIFVDQTEVRHLRTVRTEFVANVSHELRTPLASIRATAETLLDGAMHDPEFAPRFLDTIIRETDRLVRLSEDLLELSRAETTQPQPRRFDLYVLLADIVSRLAGQIERQKVTVTLLPAPADPVLIDADYNGIDQVFFNLIENAVKYTPSGGTITVALRRDAPGWIAVAVTDTGIGILSQDLPRIFERFWRADRARKFQGGGSLSGGTGLGLAIVKHIVESHGGSVAAESELGQGSRFTVRLPLTGPP